MEPTFRKCAYCDAPFTTSDSRRKYCTPAHAQAASNARRYQGDHSSAGTPEDRDVASLTRKALAAEQARSVARLEAKEAKSRVADLEEELERTHKELELYQSVKDERPEWMRAPSDDGAHHGTLVAFLSDVHAGETVKADEMFAYNAYNEDITDARLGRFFERTILVARNYLAGVEYDGIVLALGGDMVSGDIHEELTETNWCSVYEACRWLAPRLAAGIEMLAEEFGNVHVISAPGNHGRDSKKPRSKRRSAHNADTHIGHLVGDRLEGVDGITFDIPESFDVDFSLYPEGKTPSKFSMEHGDNMRFSGTSEIGALGPVKRGTLRKSRQLQNEGRPFNYNLVGHFHQYVPAYTQGFVMNGSLKGYDEYARTWHMVPEPAQQSLLVVTPEHGITVCAPVIVAKRSAEGW